MIGAAKLWIFKHISQLWKYRMNLVVSITSVWLAIILLSYYRDIIFLRSRTVVTPYSINTPLGFWTFTGMMAIMCFVMSWILVFRLKAAYRHLPLGLNLFIKSGLLVVAAFLLTLILHTVYFLVVRNYSPISSFVDFYNRSTTSPWLFDELSQWMILFILTFLFIEINEKYSPGVFKSILLGKYIKPRIEERIVIFIDLKDSTTIAEQMGHEKYFRFIRNFIYYISSSLLEHNAHIYQYVGDEVVASWKIAHRRTWRLTNKDNRRPFRALIECRRKIQKHSAMFKTKYGVVPEFRAGIHCGAVSVGEIGVIKKDLAMSGDVMNTAARIRSACNELGVKHLISEDYFNISGLSDWQVKSMGSISLKGKEDGTKLFALNI